MREYINTESFSVQLRKRAIIVPEQKILVARLSGSEQEKDLSTPVNCHGYGRIRHFRYQQHTDWSANPLPLIPATKALGRVSGEFVRAQVFQNAACNWRCWYCFVDFQLLSADRRVSDYFTAAELIDMYLEEDDQPDIIDLTGGQPDLVPEWIFWTMKAVEDRALDDKIFLWSDDNLSTRYYWEYLTPKQREYMAHFPKYARVACFKGYDQASFTLNTRAEPARFDQQFEIYQDLLKEGLDLYAYVTFTALPDKDLEVRMGQFVDRLQKIHPNLPLRTVPLKIQAFTPTTDRLTKQHEIAIVFQHEVHKAWLEELDKRFSNTERNRQITEIEMRLP